MKAVLISTAVLILVASVTGLSLVYAQRQATSLPENTPAHYIASRPAGKERPVVVCVGDSITHGVVSANYIDVMASLGMDKYDLVNAGINSELAYNINARINEIVACDPDIVTVLVGTNDAKSTLSREHEERAIRDLALPQTPDADWYRENIKSIAEKLRSKTDARIAFLSVPPIGEDPEHPGYALSGEYSQIVREEAAVAGVSYLPLYETMVSYLAENPANPVHDFAKTRSLMMASIVRHYLLGQSWDRIGEINGFALHTDHLHLNSVGAQMIAELIVGFAREGAN
jgi:acyl-CoA thioesterase I